MKPEETIDFQIKWAWHKISKIYNSLAFTREMTLAMGHALLNIDLKNGTPSTSLGPKMGMEPKSLSRLINTLEERQWIVREKDKSDGRVTKIKLTEEGFKFRNYAKQTVVAFNTQLKEQLPDSKLQAFFEVMQAIKTFELKTS